MHKNPISFGFITKSPVFSITTLWRDIIPIFTLIKIKVSRYNKERRKWSGMKTSSTIQSRSPIISNFNKLNKRSQTKSMLTF